MTTIKINVSLINTLSKDAKNNIDKITSAMMKNLAQCHYHQLINTTQQNDTIAKFLKISEDILKYQPGEIDRMVDMSLDDWLVLKYWAEYKQIEYNPSEQKK